MKTRCKNPNTIGYHRYGGRGIKVCERWEKFENFLEDMGERPEGMSLDRIDNDGDYCKENCRWETSSRQARNTRRNVTIRYDGVEMCVTEWAEKIGIPYSALAQRKKAWGEDAKCIMSPLETKKLFTFRGKTQCIAEWSRELGMPYWKLRSILKKVPSIEEALSFKKSERKRNKKGMFC